MLKNLSFVSKPKVFFFRQNFWVSPNFLWFSLVIYFLATPVEDQTNQARVEHYKHFLGDLRSQLIDLRAEESTPFPFPDQHGYPQNGLTHEQMHTAKVKRPHSLSEDHILLAERFLSESKTFRGTPRLSDIVQLPVDQ